MSAESTSHIIQALLVNVTITLAKAVAAFLTGSGALLAEAIHTGADCTNQVLLLIGLRQARRPADQAHPLGHGRNVYFWSFIVALLLFSAGGMFSIYEGIHKLHRPEPVERVWLGFAILAFSLVLEGGSLLSNIRELRRRAKGVPFFRALHDTKDSDLVVVFGENAAASLGLVLAMAALGAAAATGDQPLGRRRQPAGRRGAGRCRSVSGRRDQRPAWWAKAPIPRSRRPCARSRRASLCSAACCIC